MNKNSLHLICPIMTASPYECISHPNSLFKALLLSGIRQILSLKKLSFRDTKVNKYSSSLSACPFPQLHSGKKVKGMFCPLLGHYKRHHFCSTVRWHWTIKEISVASILFSSWFWCVCICGHVHDLVNHLTCHSLVLSTLVFLCACMLDDYDYVFWLHVCLCTTDIQYPWRPAVNGSLWLEL